MQKDKPFPEEPPAYEFATAVPQTIPPPGYAHGYPYGYNQQAYPQQGYNQQGYPIQSHGPPMQNYAAPPQFYGHPPSHGYGPGPSHGYGPAPPQNYEPPLPQGYVAPPQPPQSFGPVPPQPTSNNIVRQPPTGCCNRYQINKPQVSVMLAAILIFITGGMNLAWSIGFRSQVYYQYHTRLTTHGEIAWFIGAIIGAIISSFLPKELPKKAITLFSSAFVLISGIIAASINLDLQALTASHYMNGIANGLMFAPTLVLAGEIAAFYTRGKLSASTEQLSFSIGIFIQILLSNTWGVYGEFNPERISGTLTAIFGFAALCLAFFLIIESPVSLLISGRAQEAAVAVRRLQNHNTEAYDANAQLAEHELYVSESKELTLSQSFLLACPAFGMLLILRALNALSINTFIYDSLRIGDFDFFDDSFHSNFVIFATCRLLGSLIGSCIMDSAGRKLPTLVGLLVCSGLAFGIGHQFDYLLGYDGVPSMLIVFQLAAGIAFSGSSAYLAEAFPLAVKQFYISITFIVELLIFIIFAACDISDKFMYALGGIYITAFVLSIWALPETKRTTLREAQKKFKSCC